VRHPCRTSGLGAAWNADEGSDSRPTRVEVDIRLIKVRRGRPGMPTTSSKSRPGRTIFEIVQLK